MADFQKKTSKAYPDRAPLANAGHGTSGDGTVGQRRRGDGAIVAGRKGEENDNVHCMVIAINKKAMLRKLQTKNTHKKGNNRKLNSALQKNPVVLLLRILCR